MADPVYTLGVEFVTGSYTDITSFCLRANFERSIFNLFTPMQPDPALFEMNNESGSLSPFRNTLMQPGKNVKFEATYSGSTYPLYFGRINEITQDPELGTRRLQIEAQGGADKLQQSLLTTSLFLNINPASLFTVIMSQCNVRSFTADTFSDSVPYAWYRDRDAANALQDLINSGYYQLFVDGAGTFQFRGRYYGALGTTQASFDEMFGMQHTLNPNQIVNQMKVNANPREIDTAVGTLAWLGTQIVVPASGFAGFWLAFVDPNDPTIVTPAISLNTQVASTDYYLAANSDGTGTNLTATLSISMTRFATTAVTTLFNGTSADGYLTRFQLKGLALKERPAIGFRSDDSSSQNVFGLRAKEIENMFFDQAFLRDYAALIVNERKNPRDSVNLAFKNEFPTVLARQVGDTVAVVNSITGINSLWTIRHMRHQIDLVSGLEHSAMYEVEYFGAFPWLILDHTTYGVLDGGRQLAL